MGRLAAAVFDLDGTLVDSEREGHRVAFNDTFESFDLPYRWGVEQYGELLEITGGQQRLEHFLREQDHPDAEELARQLHEEKTRRFEAMCETGEVPARPGAERLLDELADAELPVGVATTGSRQWVEPLLERVFGLDRFAFVLTGDDVTDRKPSPAVFEKALSRLGTTPSQTVVVEDSENGLEAALEAGLPCVVVVNDYTRHHDLAAADLVVDCFGRPGQAKVLHGLQDALEDAAVTLATLERVVAAHRANASQQ